LSFGRARDTCGGKIGKEFQMDLGIRGRKAIVCASSRGLGRGCAMALAEAGVDLTLNGRDAAILARTAEEIRKEYGVSVTEVVGDVSQPEVQRALLAACPAPDILVNNNGGPPPRDFRQLDRKALLDGVTQNMVTPIELIQAVIDGMAERAGLTSFLSGIARTVAAKNVTINNMLPGKLDTDRIRTTTKFGAEKAGMSVEDYAARQNRDIPAGRLGTAEEFGKICAFLCSAHAGYMTGQNLRIDGGSYPSAF
jgi:3-oxoacyl-[acyl-carrier protein] reductase